MNRKNFWVENRNQKRKLNGNFRIEKYSNCNEKLTGGVVQQQNVGMRGKNW